MPVGMRDFISFHIEQSEIFHNDRQSIISHFAKQNISLCAFELTGTLFAKKKDRESKAFSVLF